MHVGLLTGMQKRRISGLYLIPKWLCNAEDGCR